MLLYAITAAFSLAGLKRGRATLPHYIAWPVTTLVTLVVVGLAAPFLLWVLEKFSGLTFGGNPLLLPVVLCMLGGFLGGLYWAKRGSAATRRRGGRWCSTVPPPAQMPLTIAGVALPFEDEFKHLKCIGTTGTGKSTAIRELLHAALYRGDRTVIADPDGKTGRFNYVSGQSHSLGIPYRYIRNN